MRPPGFGVFGIVAQIYATGLVLSVALFLAKAACAKSAYPDQHSTDDPELQKAPDKVRDAAVLRHHHYITRLGSAIKQQVKGCKVGNKIAPQLGIDRQAIVYRTQFDPGVLKNAGIKMFSSCGWHQIGRCIKTSAYFQQQSISAGVDIQFGESPDFSVYTQIQHQMPNNHKVKIYQSVRRSSV